MLGCDEGNDYESINYPYHQSAQRNVYFDQPMIDHAYLHARFVDGLYHCDEISVDSYVPVVSFLIDDFHQSTMRFLL